MAISISQFRTRFPEFDSIDNSIVNFAITEALALMDVARWGSRFDTGQGFLSAHFVSITPSSTGNNSGGSVAPLSGASTGPLSASFAMPTPQSMSEAMMGSTVYGQRYLQLQRLVGMGGSVV